MLLYHVPGTLWVKALWTQSQVNIFGVCSVFQNCFLTHDKESCQANQAVQPLISTPKITSITAQKVLINSWQETETRYKNNQNYGNILNPKTKQKSHEGRVSGAGQPMADGNKNNWTLNATWLEDPHTLKPILPAMCEKNFFCFFVSSASKKPHILPTHFHLQIPQVSSINRIKLKCKCIPVKMLPGELRYPWKSTSPHFEWDTSSHKASLFAV